MTETEPRSTSLHQHRVSLPVQPFEALIDELARDRRSERRWRTLKRITFAALFVGYLIAQGVLSGLLPSWPPTGHADRIAVIELAGPVGAEGTFSADLVVPLIKKSCSSSGVRGLVLRINSPGGSPDEADRIGRAIDRCRDTEHKKVVAVIDNLGASAAYLVALHADEIGAGNFSLVGSIGAILQSLDAEEGLARLGVKSRVYASGALKSAGSLVRHDTPEQARTMQSIADAAGGQFANEVERWRGKRLVPNPDRYSGRVWTALEAQKLGLVDRVGAFEDLVEAAFPGIRQERIAPRRPLAEAWSARALVGALRAQLAAEGAQWVP